MVKRIVWAALAVLACAAAGRAQVVQNPAGQFTCYGANGQVTIQSAPCSAASGGTPTPGVTGPPATGLMARYDIPASDTAAALTDSSGNGRNGTGTVGTAPTIGASVGGLVCGAANGASILPASLNTAQSIALYLTANAPVPAVSGFEALGVWGNGNGAASNSIGLLISPDSVTGITNNNINVIWTWGNNNQKNTAFQGFWGTAPVIFTMDTTDHVYTNGTEASYGQTGASQGLQTAGAYQLCGGAAGSGAGVQTYDQNMTIYEALFYDHVLTALERNQLNAWLVSQGTTRGAPPSLTNSGFGTGYMMHGQGDSLMTGNTAKPFYGNWTLNQAYTMNMRGIAGMTTALMLNDPAYSMGIDFSPSALDNLMIYDLGTNDCPNSVTAATTVGNSANQLRYWAALGGRSLWISMISRGAGNDACEQAITALMRTTWQNTPGVARLVDWQSDAALGATGASASAVFFQGDSLHPSEAGVANDETWMVQYAVNAANGNLNWSTAATYTTAAAAAVATTALSESGNTVTVTFAATPANCQAGNLIVITGVTAAGYNTTSANGFGLGGALILTRSATQVTYWDNTTGLSAATVQGTGVCPQEQDADVYAILGGSATTPSHTLQPCEGRTGQPIYRRITNTTSNWVLTPWNSSETINGGATMNTPTASATNHPVVKLVSIPNAIGTGGCTWQASLQ